MPPYTLLLFSVSFRDNKRSTSGSDLERITHINGLFVPQQCARANIPDDLHPSENMSSPGSSCVLNNPTSISPSAHGGSWMEMETESPIHVKQPGSGTIMGWEQAEHPQLCRVLAFLGRCCGSTRAAGTGKGLVPMA